MSALYRQFVADERLENVCRHVRDWLYGSGDRKRDELTRKLAEAFGTAWIEALRVKIGDERMRKLPDLIERIALLDATSLNETLDAI